MQESLSRWWVRKYKLPSNHELFQDRTIFEHLVDFYLDKFEQNPIEAQRNKDGEIQFTETGDELIDKWEEQIARGEAPDLNEAFSPESLAYLAKKSKQARGADPYANMSMKDMFDSVSEQANREGLTVGKHGLTPRQQAILQQDQHRVLQDPPQIPTFGFTEDCDD